MDYDRRAFLKASSSAAFVGAAGCGQYRTHSGP